jgi:hypothetical protein
LTQRIQGNVGFPKAKPSGTLRVPQGRPKDLQPNLRISKTYAVLGSVRILLKDEKLNLVVLSTFLDEIGIIRFVNRELLLVLLFFWVSFWLFSFSRFLLLFPLFYHRKLLLFLLSLLLITPRKKSSNFHITSQTSFP